jgi:hypothetical protein
VHLGSNDYSQQNKYNTITRQCHFIYLLIIIIIIIIKTKEWKTSKFVDKGGYNRNERDGNY